MMQHKSEALWFYRFLSLVYDRIVNPLHWTRAMRTAALAPAFADFAPRLRVLDAGGGTGFTSEGLVLDYGVPPANIDLLDQSPDQLRVAARKPHLRGVRLQQGDAERLPYPDNSFDRYVSAGSIEYWPHPSRGVAEAFRVLAAGGTATMIGPVRATNALSRFWCDLWMLFPTESDYVRWFRRAGFANIRIQRIGPEPYRGVRRHGLIMGVVVVADKPVFSAPAAASAAANADAFADAFVDAAAEQREDDASRPASMGVLRRLLFAGRFALGTVAGFYYFVLPLVVMLFARLFLKKPAAHRRPPLLAVPLELADAL
uniref:MPBQ/MBSQ family SAM-binding methyltransferase profile domain-containing protein n=1 Tax=Erythrolobus australicus TaxID=1077150 RepID=A0A7S1TL16_9RHOD|mmetsp:Transcript_3421/g.9384  ORF Transcript_3421/g.9384 Transcript_3421/m.9384 type:complete len:315 (+) Transcript_3421:1-945(+)